MRANEKEYMRWLADNADDTVSLLSNPRKPERERRICAAFLRCLGVSFNTSDLVPIKDEPPDVRFGDAAFEVKVFYGGQKVHDKWKDRARNYKNAKTIDDVLVRRVTPKPVSSAKVIEYVTSVLREQNYSPGTRAGLDALIYLDPLGAFLEGGSKALETTQLEKLGWRSVSILFPPYACVLAASSSAPDFLSRLVRVIKSECYNPDKWFEI